LEILIYLDFTFRLFYNMADSRVSDTEQVSNFTAFDLEKNSAF